MTTQFKEISDLGLIAALKSKGYVEIDKRLEGKRISFVYETDPAFEDLCQTYFDHRMEVDAFDFHMALKSVKQVIWNLQREAQV